ncbi:hypothetical protein CDAR_253161 [Caerostris darwini]|uniref:Uncharacterized protein n=1 Tax=Caerostris darwini TaxID=1538125 RepID=A0AAV4R6J0_9ARAC|nr:hypothetical protein CDAR_253161 [Caerostris darwini]
MVSQNMMTKTYDVEHEKGRNFVADKTRLKVYYSSSPLPSPPIFWKNTMMKKSVFTVMFYVWEGCVLGEVRDSEIGFSILTKNHMLLLWRRFNEFGKK